VMMAMITQPMVATTVAPPLAAMGPRKSLLSDLLQ
jgi:hypothetical protein